MNVIWKRPDGYHDAEPVDFRIMKLGSHSNLWVHKTDRDTFPFRVSGGWEEEQQTRRLNNFINLLNDDDQAWLDHLESEFNQTMRESKADFCLDLKNWLKELKDHFKGGSWEMEIMNIAFDAVADRLNLTSSKFV